jgi:hypothetical protein
MRNLTAIALATGLFATNAFAAGTAVTPLAPAKPAGLKQAQYESDNTLLYVIGLGVLAAGIAIAVSSGSSNSGTAGGSIAATTTTS